MDTRHQYPQPEALDTADWDEKFVLPGSSSCILGCFDTSSSTIDPQDPYYPSTTLENESKSGYQ